MFGLGKKEGGRTGNRTGDHAGDRTGDRLDHPRSAQAVAAIVLRFIYALNKRGSGFRIQGLRFRVEG